MKCAACRGAGHQPCGWRHGSGTLDCCDNPSCRKCSGTGKQSCPAYETCVPCGGTGEV